MQERYTIQKSLGGGGMGTLYLGTEKIANRTRKVVVKQMLDYFDPKDPQGQFKALQRFEAEAATLAELNIPGVPQIFDYFTWNERNFIVMQFIQGRSLESGLTHLDEQGNIVPGKPYPPQQVCRWGIDLCRILESLAIHGVIHMDIKPSNLIVDKSGMIWLVDFGTARAFQYAPPTASGAPSVYGTIGYAPPEQVAGKPEARSDVFALAATMYHLLTDDDPGVHPYKFPGLDRLPSDLVNSLKKALVQDVNKRIHAQEMRRILEAETRQAPPFRWRDGSVAYDPGELPAIADRYWVEACEYFRGDNWRKWFADLHRHDLVAKVEQFQSRFTSTDRGLDAFLRFLDPAFPEAQLHLAQKSLDFGRLPWEAQRTLDMNIQNRGSGCLHLTVSGVSTGVQVEPQEIILKEKEKLQVVINSGKLSPSAKPYKLGFDLQLDQGQVVRVPVKVIIPPPVPILSPINLDLGVVAQRDSISGSLTLSNKGESPCLCKVISGAAWLSVEPNQILCVPNKRYRMEVKGETSGLSLGEYQTQIALHSRADDWSQVDQVCIRLRISFWQTFIKYWWQPFAWLAGWLSWGGLWGAILGSWLAGAGGALAGGLLAALTGLFFGMFICVLPTTLFGILVGLDQRGRKEAARMGAYLGMFVGALCGGAMGLLMWWLLGWLGFSLAAGGGLGLFGGMVGSLTASVMGVILWRLWDRG